MPKDASWRACKPMAHARQTHGKCMVSAWQMHGQTHGERMTNSWQVHDNTMANAWHMYGTTHGKCMA
eukprot:9847243-Lingulodinium_polyedra.AAC.1